MNLAFKYCVWSRRIHISVLGDFTKGNLIMSSSNTHNLLNFQPDGIVSWSIVTHQHCLSCCLPCCTRSLWPCHGSSDSLIQIQNLKFSKPVVKSERQRKEESENDSANSKTNTEIHVHIIIIVIIISLPTPRHYYNDHHHNNNISSRNLPKSVRPDAVFPSWSNVLMCCFWYIF